MKANAKFDHQLLAVESEHRINCLLELTAPASPALDSRAPLHLALVLDRSGSMAGDKLEIAKRCAAYLARRLSPTDELGVVVFDDQVGLVAPLGPVEPALFHAIDSIPPGGSTNLSGGWLKGVELLSGPGGNGPRKVLLLTDGQANAGVVDRATLAAMARKACDDGVGTTTIGFGAAFDEDLLTEMADVAAGNSYFAETPDEAPAIFAQEFEGLASIVAQNVSVEIRPSDEVQLLGVLNDYPIAQVPGGMQIQMGDAYGEEHRRLVFELHVPELAALGVAKVADVIVRYVTIGEQIAAHELTIPLTVNLVSSDEAAATEADTEVTEEVVILKSARAQDEARKHADAGEWEQANKLLAQTAEELRRFAPDSSKAEELLSQAEMFEHRSRLMAQEELDPIERKRMMMQSQTVKRGRSTGPANDSKPSRKGK